ncbi:MAG: CocE/NonD family hydrolase [Roseobacter sp.]
MTRENALRDIEDLPDYRITLSDGTRLSARLWRPVDAADDPVPLILEYLPYRKRDGTVARDALTHPWFAARGYACLRVDMRGNGDSEGLMADEYTETELADAVEVITQMAAQPWCNGRVGMMGISWGGFNGLQVAARTPEPLKAVITLCSTVDRFADDIHYKGGCLLNENLGWGATMWAYSSRAPDPALRENWREMWLERLAAEPFLPALWLRHQRRDAYWKHGSVCENYAAIKARVLAVGGWGDAYKNAVPEIVQNIAGAKGIVGPWVHKYPHFAVPEPRIGFLQEALRWWDRWLKDMPNDAENLPDYRAYIMDGVRPARWYEERSGVWAAEEYGAVAHIPHRTLHLTNNGLSDAPGRLTAQIASPQDCGAEAGEYCAIWLGPEMPGDQRSDDALSLTFDTAPVEADTDLFGAPEVRLKLRSDKPQAQIAVRLNHLHPDGAVTRVTYGVLNLSHRDSHEDPSPLPKDGVVSATLKLDQIAYRIPAGHQLRLSVSTSYWPLLWPAPEAATLSLEAGSVQLPIRRTALKDQTAFEPPESAAPWPHEEIRPARNKRHKVTDLKTGVVSLVIEDDFGKKRDSAHGLVSGAIARERWDIHPDDPLSARGSCHWTEEMERDDIHLRTETYSEMWCDGEHFYLRARLEAYENDKLVCERDVEDKIARDHL